MAEKLRVGVIGCGRWGRNIIRTLRDIEKKYPVELAVVINKGNRENRKFVEEQFRVPVDGDISGYVGKLDAVFIATPEDEHFRAAKKTLVNAIHTFIEKPMTQSLAEAQELFGIAEKKGVRLAVGHILLYNDCINYIKKDIADTGQKISRIYSSRFDQFTQQAGKTLLWGSMVHDISVVDHMLEAMPAEISVDASRGNGRQEYISAFLKYHGGTDVIVQGSSAWPCGAARDFIAWTDAGGGTYYYDGVKNAVKKIRTGTAGQGGSAPEKEFTSKVLPLSLELEDFIKSILSKKPGLAVHKGHVLRVMGTIDMIEKKMRK